MQIALYEDWRKAAHTAVGVSFSDFAASLGQDRKPDTGDKRDTYAFAPAEYLPGRSRAKDGTPGPQKIAAMHALALDFDGEKKQGITAAQLEALALALSGESYVAYSSYSHADAFTGANGAGGGRYKLRIVIEISRPITCDEHARLLAYVITLLPVAPDPSCKDPTRIFGLPMMYSEHDFIDRQEGAPLDVDELLKLAPAVVAKVVTAAPLLEASLNRAEVQKLATKWARSEVPDVATRGRLTKQLINGDAFATAETERHGTMLRLTNALEREFQNATPAAIAELFRPSIATMSGLDSSYDIGTRMSDCVRAVEGARAKRLEAEAEAEAARQAEVAARIAAARADGKATEYDDDDLAAIAKAQGCKVDELEHRWIIVKGTTFYFLTLDGYKGPYSATGFPAAIRDHLAPTNLPFEHLVGNGDNAEWRMKSISELVRSYGTECMKIVASMAAPANMSTYDARSQTFTEAVCKLRDLSKPGFEPGAWDPEFAVIDEYVGLFAGRHAEKYRDWLATFPELERPTAALYLSGPKGTGKTLLPEMLARLYTTGAASDLADAWGNFNEALLNCPVIKADEALPAGATSAKVREIVGVVARTLKRKHIATAEMHGAIRLILSANRDDMLAFNETLSTDELDATAQRVLHIETQPAARDFLESTPHRHWVSGDVFARYVLWLNKTRKVQRGPRWLVEGHMPEMRAKLATSGPNERFCEWIVGYLSAPEKMAQTAEAGLALIRKDVAGAGGVRGGLWLNAQACAKQWGTYTTEAARNDTPTPGRASLALKALSTEHDTIKTKVGTKPSSLKFWRVNLDHVFDWAERNGVGDVEQMRKVAVEGLATGRFPAGAN